MTKKLVFIWISYLFIAPHSDASELLLDHNCEPASIATRIKLALKSPNEAKIFWHQQAKALSKDMSDYFRIQNLSELSERQRVEERDLQGKHIREIAIAHGKENLGPSPELIERSERTANNAKNIISSTKSKMRELKINQFVKCWTYADSLSR